MKIPGFSRYTIDEHGVVTDTITGEEVLRKQGKRYAYVYILPDECEQKVQVNLHVLLATAFCGECPTGYVASFIDGNYSNIHASNICWNSRKTICERNISSRKPKKNNMNTPESRELIYETLKTIGRPVYMLELAEMLDLPYSTVRYSMYHLIGDGRAEPCKGGYRAL